jgi:hypothetical protein
MNEAISAGNATQVKSLFDAFRRSGSSTQSGAQPRSTTSGNRTYTRDDIKQLYEQHQKGAYAGRQAEWNRIEADIFAAQRDGRLRAALFDEVSGAAWPAPAPDPTGRLDRRVPRAEIFRASRTPRA